MIRKKYKIKGYKGVINRKVMIPSTIKEYSLPRLKCNENTFKYVIKEIARGESK